MITLAALVFRFTEIVSRGGPSYLAKVVSLQTPEAGRGGEKKIKTTRKKTRLFESIFEWKFNTWCVYVSIKKKTRNLCWIVIRCRREKRFSWDKSMCCQTSLSADGNTYERLTSEKTGVWTRRLPITAASRTLTERFSLLGVWQKLTTPCAPVLASVSFSFFFFSCFGRLN